MSDRNYYVFCDDNCRFPGMTREQILAAIAEATGNTVTNVDNAFITKVKEVNSNGNLSFWVGTTAEYNAIVAADKVEKGCFYILTDDTFGDDVSAAIMQMQETVEAAEKTVIDMDKKYKEMKDGVVLFSNLNAPIPYSTTLTALEELIDVSGIGNYTLVRVLAGRSINENECSYVLCTVRHSTTVSGNFYIEGSGTGNANAVGATDNINIRIKGYKYENERLLSENTSTETIEQILNGAYIGSTGQLNVYEIVGIL